MSLCRVWHLCNSRFARCRHLTTTTRTPFVFSLLFKFLYSQWGLNNNVFLQRRRSYTSRKLYVCLESFFCFLHISDRAYVSRARCLGLGLGLFHHSSWYLNTFQPESMPMRTISSWTSRFVQILNYFLSYFLDFEIKTNAKSHDVSTSPRSFSSE